MGVWRGNAETYSIVSLICLKSQLIRFTDSSRVIVPFSKRLHERPNRQRPCLAKEHVIPETPGQSASSKGNEENMMNEGELVLSLGFFEVPKMASPLKKRRDHPNGIRTRATNPDLDFA
jgi:hypothetical protein